MGKVIRVKKIHEAVGNGTDDKEAIKRAIEESGLGAFESPEARDEFIKSLEVDPDKVSTVARLIYSTRKDIRDIGNEILTDQIEKAYHSLRKLHKMTLDDDFSLKDPTAYDNYQRAILSPIMNGAVIGVSVEEGEQLTVDEVERLEQDTDDLETIKESKYISKLSREIAARLKDGNTVH